MPTSTGGIAQVCPMSPSSHRRTSLASREPLEQHLRRPETGQVRCDDTVGRHQLRDHPHIHTAATNSPRSKTIGGPSPPSNTAVDTPGELQPSLADGQAGQQPRTADPPRRHVVRVPSLCAARSWSPLRWSGGTTLFRWRRTRGSRRCRFGRQTRNRSACCSWVILCRRLHEIVLVGVGSGRRPTRQAQQQYVNLNQAT